jgi:hypothetical protein
MHKWFLQCGPDGWFPVHACELKLWPGWEHTMLGLEDMTDEDLGDILARLQWRLERAREDLEADRPSVFSIEELETGINDIEWRLRLRGRGE